ncbi:hypothetical protein [Demequina globuliformis]|uniref:phosphotriesterase family protein n=1 Tax=Demequina globuliformis TaxID=676202 RepID=UPI0007863F04|nr:hypothetical protein [Demequina globuliformis]
MATITTVRGEIPAETLGFTSMHEHLNGDMDLLTRIARLYSDHTPPPEMLALRNENLAFLRSGASIFSAECMTVGDVEYTAAELGHFRDIGGRSVVDASPIGIRGDVRDLRAASERADVHVVTATGLYTAANRYDEHVGLTEHQHAELFRREVTVGIGDTGIRAGLLKCALSAASPRAPLSEVEVATLRACATVAHETGLSVHVHTAFPMGHEQVISGLGVLLDDMALPPDRVVMIHMDSFLRPWNSRRDYLGSLESVKFVDTTLVERVLDRGVTVGFDSWGSEVEMLPQDDDRLKGLIHLIRSGYGEQIVLGHDITQKPKGSLTVRTDSPYSTASSPRLSLSSTSLRTHTNN